MDCPAAGSQHQIEEGDGAVDLAVNLVTHLANEDREYLEARCTELITLLRAPSAPTG